MDFVTVKRELARNHTHESILSTNITDLWKEIRPTIPKDHDTVRLIITTYKSPLQDEE